MSTRRLVGAVLAGGQSRRMGRDKATLDIAGAPMAARVAARLERHCAEIVAIGGDRSELAKIGLEVVPDLHPGEGPLGGVLTALAHAGGDVLVSACDLPALDDAAVTALVASAGKAASCDVVVASTAAGLEPLFGVYRHTSLERLQPAFEQGERAPRRALSVVRWATFVLDDGRALTNVNDPDSHRTVGADLQRRLRSTDA